MVEVVVEKDDRDCWLNVCVCCCFGGIVFEKFENGLVKCVCVRTGLKGELNESEMHLR